jgi:hypothetical protein
MRVFAVARRPVISEFLYQIVERMCAELPSDSRWVTLEQVCSHPDVAASGYNSKQVWCALRLLKQHGRLEELREDQKSEARCYRLPQQQQISHIVAKGLPPLPKSLGISPEAARYCQYSHLICGTLHS